MKEAKLPLYLIGAGFCVFFAFVYSLFSHQVSSPFMTWMFLIPLAGGGLSFVLHSSTARATLASAVLTLTMGSCFAGVLEIYGTTSPYVPVYWVAGIILLVIAVVLSIHAASRS